MTQSRITIAAQWPDLDANPDFVTDFPHEPAPVPVIVAPHADVMNIDAAAMSIGEALVEDLTTSDEEIAIDFGDVDEATGFVLRNRSGQDLSVAVNGVLGGTEDAAVTAAAGALDTVLTTQLGILDAFDGGDAAADIVAAIATASTAIGTAQAALATALDAAGTAIFTMPDGAVLAYAGPANAGTPVTAISLYTTATQAGDATVDFKVFGSLAT